MQKHELEIQVAKRLVSECENRINALTESINQANAFINAIEKRSYKH